MRAEGAARIALQIVATLLALPLALFFAFVGWMKAFAPLATLAEHHAWTVAIPVWLGRAIGVSEIACALALVVARGLPGRLMLVQPTVLILVINQIAAAAVHLSLDEADALPQNAMLIAMMIALYVAAGLLRRPS